MRSSSPVANCRIAIRRLYCSHLSGLSITSVRHGLQGTRGRLDWTRQGRERVAAAGKPRCVRECLHSRAPQSLQSTCTRPDTIDTIDTMPLVLPADLPNRRPGSLTTTAQRAHEMPPAACACETTGHLSTTKTARECQAGQAVQAGRQRPGGQVEQCPRVSWPNRPGKVTRPRAQAPCGPAGLAIIASAPLLFFLLANLSSLAR